MQYDIFFSISQTPARGVLPSERQMFTNFFEQAEAADRLGFGVAWIAESHLSSEVQKHNPDPVIPHWEGEVGLNVDFLQLASQVQRRTERIACGSAILNILCNGGPVAHAERVAAYLALHELDPSPRTLHLGFAAGRFDFMNRAYGIKPRNQAERVAWRAVKGAVFARAAEMFVRLLHGEQLASDDVPLARLGAGDFRSEDDWKAVREHLDTADMDGDAWLIPPFFDFERLQIIPRDFDRSNLQLIIGSHDPATQERVNRFASVQVFNLSITRPEVIEATHERMRAAYLGGGWDRACMPRTSFVFLNADPSLSPDAQAEAAQAEAREALGAYWTALEGTLDPSKVERAATNALIGNPAQVAAQMRERFHPEDRLMLWFDFFNHDSQRVIRDMTDFMEQVRPLVEA